MLRAEKARTLLAAADIELFGIRSRQRISVRPYHAAGNARGNHLVLVYLIMIAEFAVYLQELCKRNTQQLFVLLLERLSENTINARSKVTSRAHCRLPPDRIAHTRQRCVVVGVHILKDRNKLVAQADVKVQDSPPATP